MLLVRRWKWKKGPSGTFYFSSSRGLSRGRRVDSRPKRSAVRSIQRSLPNGVPRCMLRFMAATSSSVWALFTSDNQFRGNDTGLSLSSSGRLPVECLLLVSVTCCLAGLPHCCSHKSFVAKQFMPKGAALFHWHCENCRLESTSRGWHAVPILNDRHSKALACIGGLMSNSHF